MRKAADESPLVDVRVIRGVGEITAHVPLKDAFTVLVDLLDGFRKSVEQYPELLDAGPDTIPGGTPVPAGDNVYEGDRKTKGKSLGFQR